MTFRRDRYPRDWKRHHAADPVAERITMSSARQVFYPWAVTCTECKGPGKMTRLVPINGTPQAVAVECAACRGRGYTPRSLSFCQFCGIVLKGAYSVGELRYLADLDAGRAP